MEQAHETNETFGEATVPSGESIVPKIVLVGHSDSLRELVVPVIEPFSHESSFVSNASESLERCDASTADILIVSLEMAGLNGLPLMEALRDRLLKIPVIFLSGAEVLPNAEELFDLDELFDSDNFGSDNKANLFETNAASSTIPSPTPNIDDATEAMQLIRAGAIDVLSQNELSQELGCALRRAIAIVRHQYALNQESSARQEAEDSLEEVTETLTAEVRRQTADLAHKDSAIQAILETAVDGIVTISGRGQIESFNRAAGAMFGYTAEEVIGQNVNMLMPDPFQQKHDGYLAQYLETGRKTIIGVGREVIGRRKDGSTFPVELSVAEVTHDGQHLFTGILRDISERKRLEQERDKLQGRLIAAAREAGMSQIATEVLHNVGNTLNSVNISITSVHDQLSESKISRVGNIAELIQQHVADLATFFTEDPRGRRLPDYFVQLAEILTNEQKAALGELCSLRDNIDHIKTIIATQQSVTLKSSLAEVTSLKQIVEDVLQLESPALERLGIEIVRNYEELPDVSVDRHVVIEILVNLVKNAGEAMSVDRDRSHQLTVRIRKEGEDRVRIEVSDTGTGIAADDVTQVFQHGFTTKPDGHGFGLHSSALRAQEMDGTLWAESDGPGRGATFLLELPFEPAEVFV